MAFLTICLNPTLQKTMRFSSIIPGTVNRTAFHRLDASGKGVNVTRVLTQLGKKAVHLTQLGGDMRPMFLSLCKQDGLSVEWAESKSQIRFCYTLINNDGGSNNNERVSVTELVEESEPVAAETERLLMEKFDELISVSDTIIISGTKAAGFSDAAIPSMAKKSKESGLKLILDIKGKDLIESLKYEPDIIKPNLYEFAATFAPQLIKDNDLMSDDKKVKEQIKSVMTDIAEKYKCHIILTNGSRKIFAANGNIFQEFEVLSVKTVNSIGCGDAFTAGLAAALEENKSTKQKSDFNAAINEGIRCGALNAGFEKPGVIRHR